MEALFTSPSLSPELKEHWSYLCENWQDQNVAIARTKAAKLAFFYLNLSELQEKEYGFVGKCFFYWDPDIPDQLHLLIQAERNYSLINLTILADGFLELDDQKYANPKQFLSFLMADQHIVFPRVSIDPASTLSRVLEHTFDHSCPIKHPADFPPLLLHIALANNDCATAQLILEHPFIHEDTPQSPNMRLDHLVKEAVKAAITENQFLFLEYLIAQYQFLDKDGSEAAYPLIEAMEQGNDAMVAYVTALYPSAKLALAYPEILQSAATRSSLGTYLWLLDHAPASLIINQEKLSFLLGIVLYRFGEDIFLKTIAKYKSEISWPKLIDCLLTSNIDPTIYIPSYERAGGNLLDLSIEQQADLIVHILKDFTAENQLNEVLGRFPDKSVVMQKALKKVILNGRQIEIFIKEGVHPDDGHFEHLFESCQEPDRRLDLFDILLSGVTSIDEAKKNLKLTAAFGEGAMALVMKKFPELKDDRDFLASLIHGVNRGAELLSKQFLDQALSRGSGRRTGQQYKLQEEPPKDLPIDEEILQTGIKGRVAIDLLTDVLVPRGQYEKILAVLLNKRELIKEFWMRMIFSGHSDFNAAGWQNLAQKTVVVLTQEDQQHLLIHFFHYCNPYLLALLLPHVTTFSAALLAQCFTDSMNTVEPLFVKVMADNQYLHITDELGNTLLHLAVVANNLPIVNALLEYKLPQLPNQNMLTPFDIATQKGALSICVRLQGESCLDSIAVSQLAKSYQDLHDWLMRAFLNSSSVDFYRFLSILESRIKAHGALDSNYLEFIQQLRDFAAPATLIVRFPNHKSQLEVYTGYGRQYSCYEEQQFLWGMHCEKQYQQIYREFREEKMNIYDLFMRFVQPREGYKGYGKWRMGTVKLLYRLITHFHGRYFYFWNIAQQTYRTLLANSEAYGTQAQLNDEGYQLFFERDGLRLPVSRIHMRKPLTPGKFSAYIIHSEIADLRNVLPHLSKLADEITDELQVSGQPLPKEKIALFFWLGCHITITARGNSQNMLMLHRLMYNLYGWQPAPWSLRYVQPDCIALLLPFELFYSQYYDELFDDQPSRCSTS